MKIPSITEIKAYYMGIKAPLVDLESWGSQLPIFEKLIEDLHPEIIIEVGSYKGASAIHMAQLAEKYRQEKPRSIVICVDFWQDWLPPVRKQLLPENPWFKEVPQYQQFLFNIWCHSCDDQVIPFRASSKDAAIALKEMGCVADLIYIDAGHEYDTVISDLKLYWEILRPGGIMFGHDIPMPDVKKAVCDFRIPFRIEGEHWIMQAK